MLFLFRHPGTISPLHGRSFRARGTNTQGALFAGSILADYLCFRMRSKRLSCALYAAVRQQIYNLALLKDAENCAAPMQSSIPDARTAWAEGTYTLRRNWQGRVERLVRIPSHRAGRDTADLLSKNWICSRETLKQRIRRAYRCAVIEGCPLNICCPQISALQKNRQIPSSTSTGIPSLGRHVRVQAGGGTSCGVRAACCGSGAVTGRGRADVVELDQGAQVRQAGGRPQSSYALADTGGDSKPLIDRGAIESVRSKDRRCSFAFANAFYSHQAN